MVVDELYMFAATLNRPSAARQFFRWLMPCSTRIRLAEWARRPASCAAARAGGTGNWFFRRAGRRSAERVDQQNQLGDVVAVAAGEVHRQRSAAGVADQVVLGAGAAEVDRRPG
jgi:hypothetical protein